jgi:hypothetical protein
MESSPYPLKNRGDFSHYNLWMSSISANPCDSVPQELRAAAGRLAAPH